MPKLRNGNNGDSNPGSLDCESGIHRCIADVVLGKVTKFSGVNIDEHAGWFIHSCIVRIIIRFIVIWIRSRITVSWRGIIVIIWIFWVNTSHVYTRLKYYVY